MDSEVIRIGAPIAAGVGVLYGGGVIYQAVSQPGGWDDLDLLCKISVIVWVPVVLLSVSMWARCHATCKGDAFPDSCRDACAAVWGGLIMLASLLLGIFCHVIHFPPSPPT